jgi:hypothetical protein
MTLSVKLSSGGAQEASFQLLTSPERVRLTQISCSFIALFGCVYRRIVISASQQGQCYS